MDNKLETIFKEIIETEKQIETKRALTVESRLLVKWQFRRESILKISVIF
jgi:hypothetical protein